jgi:hypothetical protein
MAVCVVVLAALPVSAQDLTISRANPPVLVVPDEGTLRVGSNKSLGGGLHVYDLGSRAAALLQEYFKKITGAESKIMYESEWELMGKPPAVLLGHTRQARMRLAARSAPEVLKRGGYIIHSIPGRIFITGADDRGTYHGASAFLEDFCGVEWFWPTELGEEVPKENELKFTRLDITFVPAMSYSSSGITGADVEWMLRLGSRQWEVEWPADHSLGVIFHPKWRQKRPEWYPLLEGERLAPSSPYFSWQPDMGSQSARERALSQALARFHQHPEEQSFSLGLADGAWTGGRSGDDLASDGPAEPVFETAPFHFNPTYSRRWYLFASWVADELQKECPGRIISGYSYSGTDLPPANVNPNKNLAIDVVGSTWSWLSKEFRRWDELRLERWSRLVPHIMKHDYMYPQRDIPTYAPRFLSEVVRTMHKYNLTSHYGEVYAALTPFGPQFWTHVKMCHDPTRDIELLLDRWMRGMFKESVEPMRRYYDTLEQAWLNYPYHARNTAHWGTGSARTLILLPEQMETMGLALDEAERRAEDGRIRRRLKIVRAYFIPLKEYSRALWRQRPYHEPVDFNDEVIALDLADHVSGVPIFDNNAHYKEYLKDEPLFFQSRMAGTTPYDTPHWRLNRVVDGILAEPLKEHSSSKNFNPVSTRQAVRKRISQLMEKAGISGKDSTFLETLTSRMVFIPRVDKGPKSEIDGEFWNDFPEYSGFVRIPPAEPGAIQQAGNETSFRIVHDGRQFYLFIDCRQEPESISASAETRVTPRMRAEGMLPEAHISKDDRIMITLAPWQFRFMGRDSGRLDVTVNARGLVEESCAGYGAFFWKTSTAAVSRLTKNGYQIQVSIPFQAANYSPESGHLLHFNIRRFVTGEAAETSAWYPCEPSTRRDVMDGNVFAVAEHSDPRLLLNNFTGPSTLPIGPCPLEVEISNEEWQDYVLSAPGGVDWSSRPGQPVSISGGRILLLNNKHLRIQPGHVYEFMAVYRGNGRCFPSMRWYQRIGQVLVDIDEARQEELVHKQEKQQGKQVVVARVTAPEKAETARLAIECEKNIELLSVTLTPRLPVGVDVNLDMEDNRIVAGRMMGLQAKVSNISDTTLKNLRVNLMFPAGVDIVSHPVTADNLLEPGRETTALWSLMPVYFAGGETDFVLVIEADNMPRTVTRVRGPLAEKSGKKQ